MTKKQTIKALCVGALIIIWLPSIGAMYLSLFYGFDPFYGTDDLLIGHMLWAGINTIVSCVPALILMDLS